MFLLSTDPTILMIFLFIYLKSNLEFTLRQQEFIELIREQKCVEAVYHARKYFVSLTPQQLIDVQKSMVLLAYAKSSDASSHVNT
jgi:macrophage erythroblast attacher